MDVNLLITFAYVRKARELYKIITTQKRHPY